MKMAILNHSLVLGLEEDRTNRQRAPPTAAVHFFQLRE